ncbi:MAG: DUF222 domain-containing protein [Actinobacteria bacterium]|nr:DUF222 domain-containing protein [Actinomycetota bacterium]
MQGTAVARISPPVAHPAADVGFEQIRSLLEAFRQTDRTAASDEHRLAWLDGIRDLGRRVTALTAVLVAEADEAGSAMRARHTRLEDWMARSGQETPRQASSAVWTARALERRPAVRDAAASGRISVGQAKAIGEALDALPTSLDGASRTAAEQLILAEAQNAPAEKLRTMTDRILRQVAPDMSDSPEDRAARLAERDVRARSRRKLWFGSETDGSIEFGGSLPVVAGYRLQAMVQAVSDRRYRSAKDRRDRSALEETPQQRAADALVGILDEAQSGQRGPAQERPIPVAAAQLQVLIPYQDLLDRAAATAVLPDGTPLSAGELRVLACDADLIPAVLGSDSQVLDLGRTVRLAPPSLRRAIGLRDGGCAFPGCTAPMRHCDLHHVRPWQEGGRTDRDNVVALCRVHHAVCEPRPPTVDGHGRPLVTDGWHVRIDRRGLPEFLPPRAMDPARTPVRRTGYAATLFDHGQPRRAG